MSWALLTPPRWGQLPTPGVGGRAGTLKPEQRGKGPLALWLVRGPPAPATRNLCPAVTKGGNRLRLEVDLQSNHTLGPAPAASADAPVPLYLGGLPGECGLGLGAGGGRKASPGDQAPGSPCFPAQRGDRGLVGCRPLLRPVSLPPPPPDPWTRPPAYRGCMRNLVVNQALVSWPRAAGVQGAVGAGGCPAT